MQSSTCFLPGLENGIRVAELDQPTEIHEHGEVERHAVRWTSQATIAIVCGNEGLSIDRLMREPCMSRSAVASREDGCTGRGIGSVSPGGPLRPVAAGPTVCGDRWPRGWRLKSGWPDLQPRERRLRVGLLLDGFEAPAWTWWMLKRIMAGGYADICLVIVKEAAPAPESNGIVAKLIRNRGRLLRVGTRKLLETAYSVLIERKTLLPDSDEPKSLVDMLAGVPVLHVRPIESKWSDRYTDDDLQRIAQVRADVLIRCGSRMLKGGILKAARYGIWSYHHGDNRIHRGGPAAFWESMQHWPETGCILQILSSDIDNGTVLYRSYSCTNAMSVLDNRRNSFWKSLSFLPRKLCELHQLGSREFFRRVDEQNAEPGIYSRRLYRKPTNAEYTRLLAAKVAEKVSSLWLNLRFRRQWIVLYDMRPQLSSSLWRYKRLVPPKDRFWADPHAVEWNGRYYLFIEEALFANGKGRISVIEIDAKGNCSEPVVVLERPYHLSYPFVFRHEGGFYMMPESAQNSTIELYRCVDFPNVWEFQENLMTDIKAYDATMTYHDGRYWLFANMTENPGASSCDELFLFHSEKPFGAPWTPHPMNPVVSDCKSARPAGALFSVGGRLYRPAQDCSNRYGYGFVFSRVDVLNQHEYREVVVSRAGPDWANDVIATHTFSRAGALNVIDAQILVRR